MRLFGTGGVQWQISINILNKDKAWQVSLAYSRGGLFPSAERYFLDVQRFRCSVRRIVTTGVRNRLTGGSKQ
uniref:Uncharacterized protein n=1 Tax=Romanomermis culicivorax TaxID=13658 RepID=A0A915KBA8_ROMCU